MFRKILLLGFMTAVTFNSSYSSTEVLYGFDDGFKTFSTITYNRLPEVEDADAQLKKSNVLKEFLNEVQSLATEHGVQDFMGVRLVHHHFKLPDGFIMVEHNEISKKGNPILVTRMQQEIDTETTYPASWTLGKNGYEVFEYSTDLCVKARYEQLKYKTDFFSEFRKLAKNFNVENLLVPAILERKIFEQLTEETACSEKSYETPSRSVVRIKPIDLKKDESEKITTAWMLNPSPMTFRCIASFWCTPTNGGRPYGGHLPYNAHNKF